MLVRNLLYFLGMACPKTDKQRKSDNIGKFHRFTLMIGALITKKCQVISYIFISNIARQAQGIRVPVESVSVRPEIIKGPALGCRPRITSTFLRHILIIPSRSFNIIIYL